MLSSKAHYISQVLSEVCDYGREHDLLQWHFDVYVFRKVALSRLASGVHNDAGIQLQHWSAEYWVHQQAICMDIVEQLGYPDLFLTISPYEWSLPWPHWLERARGMLGLDPTELPGQETLCLAHLLTQVVKGFVCGKTGGKTWTEHLLADKADPARSNVRCVLARHEFQEGDRRHDGKGRGAMHVHVLIWLRSIRATELHTELCAQLPSHDPEVAALAQRLQRASEAARAPAREESSAWVWDAQLGRWMLLLQYPLAARMAQLRPFFPSLLRVLRCAMDVQWWHGRGALLNYVTGYTTKFKERWDASWALQGESHWTAGDLYSKHWQCAEPQMVMTLAREPMVYTTALTKHFRVPARAEDLPASHSPYCHRCAEHEELSFLQWLRLHREMGSVQAGTFAMRPYQRRDAPDFLLAVGVVYRKITRDVFFWQWMLMNVPHRSQMDLESHRAPRVTDSLRWYAAALQHAPDQWASDDWIKKYLELRGHRKDFVESTSARLAADRWLVEQQLLGELSVHQAPRRVSTALELRGPVFNAEQTAVLRDLESELLQRAPGAFADEALVAVPDAKPRFVTGCPGSGKSFLVAHFASGVLQAGGAVLVTTPAARLGGLYRSKLPDATVATVHKAFGIPVARTEASSWPVSPVLARFQVIIVDETSLLSRSIFEHILRCWMECGCMPVLVFVGDFCQLPPIPTSGSLSGNALASPSWCRVHVAELVQEVRCEDPELVAFLRVARSRQPSREALDIFTDGLVESASLENLVALLQAHPDATILCISRAACSEANAAAMHAFATEDSLLGSVPTWRDDGSLLDMPVFRGMRVAITRNHCEEKGIMNGESATVLALSPAGVCVQMEDGSLQAMAPNVQWVSSGGRDVLRAAFELAPGYATTVFKSQGATLPFVIFWADCRGGPGIGYVACSRVRRREHLRFFGPVLQSHFEPVVA